MFLLIGMCMMTAAPLAAVQPSESTAIALLQRDYKKAYENYHEAQKQAEETHQICFKIAKALFAERDPASWFINKDCKPTERLIELLKLDDLYDPTDYLPEIVEKTQKSWIGVQQGRGGKERTDLQDSDRQAKTRETVEKIVKEIGLLSNREPLVKHYDYAVCYGAFLDGVRMHFANLVDSWKKGVRFNSLVFLTGERTLRKESGQQDAVEFLTDQTKSQLKFKEGWTLQEGTKYETEYDLCKIVWDQSEIPEDMRQALEGKVVFVDSPRPEKQERPGTKDTYYTWLKDDKPAPGTVLAFSYPILWSYQHVAAENCLGENFALDTCAPAAPQQMLIANQERLVSIVQDTVAKILYELNQRQPVSK